MTSQTRPPQPNKPPRWARRRLYASLSALGIILFIVGCYLAWTKWSDNPGLFNLGFLVLAPVGGLVFVICAIKWRNARPRRKPTQAPPATPTKLNNGTS